jgi:hypothetical protein
MKRNGPQEPALHAPDIILAADFLVTMDAASRVIADRAVFLRGGRTLVENGRLNTADMAELIARVHTVAPALFARRAACLAQNQHRTAASTEPTR